METGKKALKKAIAIVGGQAKLAKAIGGKVRQGHVSNWLLRCKVAPPAEHCVAIERATGGRVTRYELRPDVFGEPPTENSAA